MKKERQKKLAALQAQDYSSVSLSGVTENQIKKVEKNARNIYGNKWNYYSNALRREVVKGFESCIHNLNEEFSTLDYLEIGSCQGLSMGIVGSLLKAHECVGELISIDPYLTGGYLEGSRAPNDGGDRRVNINKETKEKALNLYQSLDLKVKLIEKKSEYGTIDLIKKDKKYHLIYIDGYHQELSPLIDFGLCFNLLIDGGIVMIDDHHWEDVAPIKSLCDTHCFKIHENWKVAAYKIKNQNSK